MTNVVHVIYNYFPYEVVTHSSQLLKERHQDIEKNVVACISAFLLALLLRIKEGKFLSIYKKVKGNDQFTEHFSQVVIAELHRKPVSPNEGLVGKYNSILNESFGSDFHKIIDSIAGYSGTKSVSTHHILSAVAPISIKVLKEQSELEGMSIPTFLLSQKENIIKAIPPHSEILDLLGIINQENLEMPLNSLKEPNEKQTHNLSSQSVSFKRKYAFLILFVFILIIIFIWILVK